MCTVTGFWTKKKLKFCIAKIAVKRVGIKLGFF